MNDISKLIGEGYRSFTHKSGLRIRLCPMKGFSSAYVMFATEYGSIDVDFKTVKDDDFIKIPAGTAHFLEHKLFESEEGDAFIRYAATGAAANAYTSFDRTAYLFSCTDNFKESLEILLDFVTKPYFTPETVQKEQGIIGQEIKMYEDSPDWRVMFNMISAMYTKSSVREDIAGTVESIAQINADILYRCYRTFYNLENMALVVAGNFDEETVIELADKYLKPAEKIKLERKVEKEPLDVGEHYIEQKLTVAAPIFNIGFKGVSEGKTENLKNSVLDELVQEIIIGESSELYEKLYNEGLIDQDFGTEAFSGRDYMMMIFSGQSKSPEKVYSAIKDALAEAIKNGVDAERFEICKKTLYGRYLRLFDKVENVANVLLATCFADLAPWDMIETAACATPEKVNDRLRRIYDPERSTLSVVKAE